MCLFCVCNVLCLGSGLATGRSHVQGVLPIVNRSGDYKRPGPMRAVEPMEKQIYICCHVNQLVLDVIRICNAFVVPVLFLVMHLDNYTNEIHFITSHSFARIPDNMNRKMA
jgi:hypothetical protein